MNQLEACLRTIHICAEMQIKSAYIAELNVDRISMLKSGILETINMLSDVYSELGE